MRSSATVPVRSLLCLLALTVLAGSSASAQTPLSPIPGSPFTWYWGINSNVLLPSPDGKWVFVSNQNSDTVSVLSKAVDGTLSMQGTSPVSWSHSWYYPTGMATNPAGDRLYVVACDRNGSAAISLLSVDGSGALTPLGDTWLPWPSYAQNGIVYASLPGGDFVYVNNNVKAGNSLTAYSVASDGSLVFQANYTTNGAGWSGGFYSSQHLVTATNASGQRYLFANNIGTDNIASFAISDDGTLSAVAGSPFPLPDGVNTNGAIAVDPDCTAIYTGGDGQVARMPINTDGTIGAGASYATGLYWQMIPGLTVRPDGAYLVVCGFSNQIAVIETASMRPVVGSPRYGDGDGPFGPMFDGLSRLYVGNAGYYTQVSAYNFIEQPALPPLAITLSVDPDGAVSRTGEATVSGTLAATDPNSYWMNIEVRQRIGHSVVSASGGCSVSIGSINGSASWSWKASNPTQAFKGGSVEVTVTCAGSDPVTGEVVTAQTTQTVKLKSTR